MKNIKQSPKWVVFCEKDGIVYGLISNQLYNTVPYGGVRATYLYTKTMAEDK